MIQQALPQEPLTEALLSIAVFTTEFQLRHSQGSLSAGVIGPEAQQEQSFMAWPTPASPLRLGLGQTPLNSGCVHSSLPHPPRTISLFFPLPLVPMETQGQPCFQAPGTGRVQGLWDYSQGPGCLNCQLADSWDPRETSV